MSLIRAISDLNKQGYKITFEVNPANLKFLAITMNHHGVNIRGNLHEDIFTEDQVCKSLKHIKEKLDIHGKGIILET